MRALAYTARSGYVEQLARAFILGCRRHNVDCELRWAEEFGAPEPCDVIWLYGLIAMARVFAAYRGLALRVTGDLGYWRERASELPIERRPVRIAVDAQQPDAHLRLRVHPPDRFVALNLDVVPVTRRGAHVLVCGQCAEQARHFGYDYGKWEAAAVDQVRAATLRPVLVREKPGSAPLDIPHAGRCEEPAAADAIRKAWAVVVRSGNIGADAILHGVPVFAESGPGAVYHRMPLAQIEQARPLDACRRIAALADISYWQWTPEEFASGALWGHLKDEGMVD